MNYLYSRRLPRRACAVREREHDRHDNRCCASVLVCFRETADRGAVSSVNPPSPPSLPLASPAIHGMLVECRRLVRVHESQAIPCSNSTRCTRLGKAFPTAAHDFSMKSAIHTRKVIDRATKRRATKSATPPKLIDHYGCLPPRMADASLLPRRIVKETQRLMTEPGARRQPQ